MAEITILRKSEFERLLNQLLLHLRSYYSSPQLKGILYPKTTTNNKLQQTPGQKLLTLKRGLRLTSTRVHDGGPSGECDRMDLVPVLILKTVLGLRERHTRLTCWKGGGGAGDDRDLRRQEVIRQWGQQVAVTRQQRCGRAVLGGVDHH